MRDQKSWCHKVATSLYRAAVRRPFTWTKGPSANPSQTAPDHCPSSTKLYSWHQAFQVVAFLIHPPIDCQSSGAWLFSPNNTFFSLDWSPVVLCHGLQLTLGIACCCLGYENPSCVAPDAQFVCFQRQFKTLEWVMQQKIDNFSCSTCGLQFVAELLLLLSAIPSQ